MNNQHSQVPQNPSGTAEALYTPIYYLIFSKDFPIPWILRQTKVKIFISILQMNELIRRERN